MSYDLYPPSGELQHHERRRLQLLLFGETVLKEAVDNPASADIIKGLAQTVEAICIPTNYGLCRLLTKPNGMSLDLHCNSDPASAFDSGMEDCSVIVDMFRQEDRRIFRGNEFVTAGKYGIDDTLIIGIDKRAACIERSLTDHKRRKVHTARKAVTNHDIAEARASIQRALAYEEGMWRRPQRSKRAGAFLAEVLKSVSKSDSRRHGR